MRFAVASSSILALPSIVKLQDSGHQFVGLITKPDLPRGRGRILEENELAVKMQELGHRIEKPGNDAELAESLKSLDPEIVITISYGKLVKANELRLPRFGWINLHFSLLPKYRGAAPVQWSIMNGEPFAGVTVFRLDQGMDTGPILVTASRKMNMDETTGELLQELADLGAGIMDEALEKISNGDLGKPQESNGSLAPKITKDVARIDWEKSAIEIERLIRAMAPTPGAWTTLENERFRIFKGKVIVGKGRPGEIMNCDPLIVATKQGLLEINEVQIEGKRRMSASDWQRGARVTVGTFFE